MKKRKEGKYCTEREDTGKRKRDKEDCQRRKERGRLKKMMKKKGEEK